MPCSAKIIIKIGLLAEILTMMLGQVGELMLHYRTYSEAMDITFGHYRLIPDQYRPFELMFDPAKLKTDRHVPQFVHKEHQNPDVIISKIIRPEPLILPPKRVHTTEWLQHGTTIEKFNHSDTSTILYENHDKIQPKIEDSKDSFWNSITQPIMRTFNIDRPFDPRPLLMLIVVSIFNLTFTIGVLSENLTILTSMIAIWLLYLIACILQLYNRELHSTTVMSFIHDPIPTWISLSTSVFLILVLFIIIFLDLLFIIMVFNERRYNVMRRVRSRNIQFIPLVKSKDLDLDEI